jgi:hypothetical protein
MVGRLVGLVAIAVALTLAALIVVFVLFFAGAFAPSRPWTMTALLDLSSMQPQPMVLRVHDGDASREFLIRLWAEDEPEEAILDVDPRPTGPTELVDPATCMVVAVADSPRTGPGVRVEFRVDGADQWVLTARVDTALEVPRAPIPSGSICDGGRA